MDLFSGGCAITHAALLSGKWDEILANDLCPLRGQDLFRLACQGEYNKEDYYRIPTKQEFYEKRDVEPHMIAVWGWNGRGYLGQNWYDQMKARGLTDIHEVPKELFDPTHRLRRLQRLTGLDLSKVEFTQSDYRQYEHKEGDVVYCDVPYKGTLYGGYQTKFDTDAFWEWARTRDYPVYVSEYNAPEDFACIWQKHRLGI